MSCTSALIFAAGLGERMRPLTDHTPKPLLAVGGKPLVVWHIENLARAGVQRIVLNTSWLADKFEPALGDGSRWGVHLHYSYEGSTPLETGGGMWHAMVALHEGIAPDAPFIAVNGDVWTDFEFSRLPSEPTGVAHLLLVANPEHNPAGDFGLHSDGAVTSEQGERLTFSGIGIYRPALFNAWREVIGPVTGVDSTPPRFKLAPLLRHAMASNSVSGELHAGAWTDVGTPARLAALDAELTR